MLSFFNDHSIKATHVAQAKHHAEADMLLSGTYRKENGHFRGCSIGCFAYEINPKFDDLQAHALIAETRGLPEWLMRLQDSMFEGLPADDRARFHVELAERIPVGKNLEPVKHGIAVARIDRLLVIQRKALEAKHGYGVHEAIEQTITALEIGRRAHEAAAGGNLCELPAAYSAADSAACSAAYSACSAARSAAYSAAYSAADSAYSAADSAYSAYSAARSAADSAYSAARSAAWQAERDALFAALDKANAS